MLDSDNDGDNDSDNDRDNDSDSDGDKAKNKVKIVTYRLKCIDSYIFMQISLSNHTNNVSEINNKEPKNKFTDSMRFMQITVY